MSENLDSILSALDDAPEAEEKPKRAPTRKQAAKPATKAAPKAAATVEQRGRRGDPNYSQVNANVPNELKASLFYYLKMEGRTLEEVIEEALSAYVEERGGLISAPTPKRRK